MEIEDTPMADIRIGHVSYEWAQAQKIKTNYYREIDSTNTKAKADAFTDDTLSEQVIVYFTDLQTAGRGRGSNTWVTQQPGSQLLSSWSFMLGEFVQPVLSPLLGLALYRACLGTWPFLNFNLKAPNDLYIADKKVAGLLIETVTQGDDIRLIIGLGLNVLSAPTEIHNATSLVSELPKNVPLLAGDWISFLERFIFEVAIAIQLAAEPLNTTSCAALIAALNQHPLLKEKYISIDSEGNLETKLQQINWLEL